MHTRIASICSAALLCASFAAPAIALAQPTPGINQSSVPAGTRAAAPERATTPASAAPNAAASREVSDAQLRKFVASAEQVAALSTEYTQRLQQTSDAQAKQQLANEANQRMAAAVEAGGLSVDEFNRISEAMEKDPQLHERARQMLPKPQPTPR